MSVRIIAGFARGRVIQTPPGKRMRPTLNRVREALFSSLMPRVEGAVFLDLFAGSGANGIEALSRGAASCVFVDNDSGAVRVIRANLEHTQLMGRAEVLLMELPQGLARLVSRGGQFDIIFADPPYDYARAGEVLEGIAGGKLLRPGGICVVEHRVKQPVPPVAAPGLSWERTSRYGETALSFFVDTT